MLRVLIVDDSPTARLSLRGALERDPELYVIAEADGGAQALALARKHRPDVVTMDVVMRRESGMDIAAALMAEAPCPIVIVTACDTRDPKLAVAALQAGALEVVAKLPPPHDPAYAERVRELRRVLRNVASIPVVRRRRKDSLPRPVPNALLRAPPNAVPRLIAIGASTGGPERVRELLAALPKDMPAPIVVAQHIARGFGRGLCDWLEESTGQRVVYVDHCVPLAPHTVFVAPDDGNLVIDRRLRAGVEPAPALHGCPSVDALFQSAAAALGPAVVAVLMTGMGKDGALGACRLTAAGSLVIVQDPSTCAVSSMPESALRAAPECLVLAPAAMPSVLRQLCRAPALVP